MKSPTVEITLRGAYITAFRLTASDIIPNAESVSRCFCSDIRPLGRGRADDAARRDAGDDGDDWRWSMTARFQSSIADAMRADLRFLLQELVSYLRARHVARDFV